MELYLIRHTTPAMPPGVCYGQEDVDLAVNFLDEAETVRRKLAGVAPAACYSSPLQRCARLASILNSVESEPLHDARLMELHFGAWETKAWNDIPRHELDRWGQQYVDEAPPGGETFRDLHRRAAGFMQDLLQQPFDGPVLAVTHAGVIRALLAEVLGMPLASVFRFHLDYGSVTKLHFHDNLPTVAYVNR